MCAADLKSDEVRAGFNRRGSRRSFQESIRACQKIF